MEIQRALASYDTELGFHEAASVKQALQLLKAQHFDLLTLDIEFDRMTEGIDVLPEIFEGYPTLNIIVISGKLNKAEVTGQLFRFTRDNVLKGKRWARHFDVLDKKDDKTEAIRRAYSFAFKQKDFADNLRDLFLLAESYLEKDEMDKCIDVYQRIQHIVPGEAESEENIRIFKGGVSAEQALEYYRRGERVVASLILGHHVERRLRSFTRKVAGTVCPGLADCLKELERSRRIGEFKHDLFRQLLRMRNKAIHHPADLTEEDIHAAIKGLSLLEARY